MSNTIAVEGVLDLINEDFSGTLFYLNGEWEYYEGKLYNPADFESGKGIDSDKTFINVPLAWHHAKSPLYGFATYRLIIKTDEPELMMFIPEIMDASIIWINGNKVFEAGVIGETKSETVARVRNAFASMRPENGEAEIVIQAANYYMIESWGTFGIEIGRPGLLLNNTIGRRVLAGIFIGLLLAVFLYYGLVFFYRKEEYGTLFIAALSLLGAIYFTLERNSFASFFLPGGLGIGLNRFYFLLIILQLYIVIGFIIYVLRIPVKNWLTRIFYALSFIVLLFIVFLPYNLWNTPLSYTGLIPGGFCFISALRSGKLKENSYNIFCVFSIVIVNFWNHFCWYILHDTFFLQGVASYMFLVLSQCIILSISYAETKQREEILTERNALLGKLNRLKTEFLQDMSHEMKTPLTLIATGIDYTGREIKKENADVPKALTVLEKIQNETQRLGRMIEGMLKLTAMNEISVNRRRVDFAVLLTDSAESFRLELERRGINLKIEIAPGLPDVFVEKDRFTQVIANLLTNSADHTVNGEISLVADNGRSFITVKVTDTGVGISPGLLPEIFKRGISGRSGTGYGLNLCKTIVEAHGGTIEIDSGPDKGTTVKFTVPVYGGQEVGHKI